MAWAWRQKMFLKRRKAKTVATAERVCRRLVPPTSEMFPFLMMALIEDVLKSHSLHLRGKLSSLPMWKK